MWMTIPTASFTTAVQLLNDTMFLSACINLVNDRSINPIHHVVLLSISNFQWPFLSLTICSVTWLPDLLNMSNNQLQFWGCCQIISTQTLLWITLNRQCLSMKIYQMPILWMRSFTYGSLGGCPHPNRKEQHNIGVFKWLWSTSSLVSFFLTGQSNIVLCF